jgi:hypothetical protein
MIIGLAGDWHGNTLWAQNVLSSMKAFGVTHVEQLGDFGVWPGVSGQRYLDAVQGAARRAGITVYVTEGNHEDYDQINAMPIGDDGLRRWEGRPNIALRTRGMRWELGGRSFVSLGGAPSIDFQHRQEGSSWWRAEMITEAQAYAVAEAGYADIMLAHDAPDGGTQRVQEIIDSPDADRYWSRAGLNYAKQGRTLMNLAFYGVKPALFAHGHFHVWDDTGPAEDGGTRFLSLNADGFAGAACLLDLETMKVCWDGKTWV